MLPGIKQFDLTGKTAIVTGGSKGLGQAMAEGLASAGANLLITSRNAEEAESVAAQIASEYGVKAIGISANVADPDAVTAMVERGLREFNQMTSSSTTLASTSVGPLRI